MFSILAFVVIAFLAFTVPAAAKTLGVIVFVFAALQILKQWSVLQAWLSGWKAVLFNAIFSALGLLVAIPAADLYNWNTIGATFLQWLTIMTGAAGIHGTYSKLTAPKDDK